MWSYLLNFPSVTCASGVISKKLFAKTQVKELTGGHVSGSLHWARDLARPEDVRAAEGTQPLPAEDGV